jgi:hypothetical protein
MMYHLQGGFMGFHDDERRVQELVADEEMKAPMVGIFTGSVISVGLWSLIAWTVWKLIR